MPLSNETIQRLSVALIPEITKRLNKDDRFFDYLVAFIHGYVGNIFGPMDDDLRYAIAMQIGLRLVVKDEL